MHVLVEFMASLNQEKYKLVQIGTIKSNKDQALVVGVSNPSKGKKKATDSKQQNKKKQDKPKSSDGSLNQVFLKVSNTKLYV